MINPVSFLRFQPWLQNSGIFVSHKTHISNIKLLQTCGTFTQQFVLITHGKRIILDNLNQK